MALQLARPLRITAGTWLALRRELLPHWSCLRSPLVALPPAGALLSRRRRSARPQEDSDDESSHQGGAEIAAHMARYEPIKKALIIIEGNVTEVNALKAKNKNTATEKQRKGEGTARAALLR